MNLRLKRPRNAILLMVAIAFLTFGCGTDSNEDPSVSGSWLGTATINGGTMTMSIQLQENSGSLNGNGTLTFVDPLAINATGTHNYPNVSMTIRSSDLQDMNFNATMSGDGNALTGTLQGSGFNNFSFTLRRQ